MPSRKAIYTILGASSVWPLGFLMANMSKAAALSRVVLFIAGLATIGLLLDRGLRHLGEPTVGARGMGAEQLTKSQTDRAGADSDSEGVQAADAAVGILVFSYFGLVSRPLAAGDSVVLLILGLLATLGSALAVRNLSARVRFLPGAIRWGIVAALGGPLALLVLSPAVALAKSEQSDVVIVFLDGYAGAESLTTLFAYDNSRFYSDLAAAGFAVQPDAVVSYSMTYASIASTLEGDYPVTGGVVTDPALRSDLYDRMGGSNSFVARLMEAGYHYTHIESGWGGTRCGHEVDVCVAAPIMDETLWTLLDQTAISPLIRRTFGHAFTIGGLAAFESLGNLDLDNGRPDLIVAHSMIPHPPLFLEADCTFRYRDETSGLNVWAEYLGDEARPRSLTAYTNQLRCTNRKVIELVNGVPSENTVLVIAGDHGSDSLGQLLVEVETWDESQIAERMSTLLAMRGCSKEPSSELINSLSVVQSCLGIASEPVKVRRFLVPVEENHPGAEVIELAGGD